MAEARGGGGGQGVDNVYTQHEPLLQQTIENIMKGCVCSCLPRLYCRAACAVAAASACAACCACLLARRCSSPTV